jgi:hypothetical protein
MINRFFKLTVVSLILLSAVVSSAQTEKTADVKALQSTYAKLISVMGEYYFTSDIKSKEAAYELTDEILKAFDDMMVKRKGDEHVINGIITAKHNFSLFVEYIATPFLETEPFQIPREWYFFYNSKVAEYYRQLVMLGDIVTTGRNDEIKPFDKNGFPSFSDFPE